MGAVVAFAMLRVARERMTETEAATAEALAREGDAGNQTAASQLMRMATAIVCDKRRGRGERARAATR
jgi:hypothetical protein